jgi:trimethylamine--corrinoid protein Co-methyltransferase
MDGPRQRRFSRKGRERRRQSTPLADKLAQPVHNIPVYEVLTQKEIDLIHQKSLEVLSDAGIDFYLEEAREILKEHGARVNGQTVYFDPDMVMDYVAKAPSEFIQLARNPENNIRVGGNHMVFAPVYGPPFVYDLEFGRRDARLEDFQNFVKLAYLSPYLNHSGGTVVEPTDIPPEIRHLDMLYSHIAFSDKPFMGSVMSSQNAQDSVKMAEMLFGADQIRENPALLSLINISSPRRLDERMLEALTVYARARQATIITPFILSGAMSPVSLAGTLIQQNAEALAGITYAQMVEPGTPVVYGSFMTSVDLKSGAPVFGSSESQLAVYAGAQLARRYNLPFRSGGMFASSKVSDAQSAYESVMTMLPAIQARVNFILHAAGWLENGLVAGYEKFVLDCDLLGQFYRFLKGIDFSEDMLAMQSIKEVQPGGHHLGTPFTMQHFTTAFYRSELFDLNSYEEWAIQGKKTAPERAAIKVKQMLASYEQPELDEALDNELQTFINSRKAEITSA